MNKYAKELEKQLLQRRKLCNREWNQEMGGFLIGHVCKKIDKHKGRCECRCGAKGENK